jgi:hypothetical protein
VVLCTPNNPTGSWLTREEIERVHDETDAMVLLDQAYVEFGGYDAIPLLAGRPRLVVLRTFSKAMALAGLRAGYLLADPALAAEIHKAKLPYNVNFFTEVAAAEVLAARDDAGAAASLPCAPSATACSAGWRRSPGCGSSRAAPTSFSSASTRPGSRIATCSGASWTSTASWSATSRRTRCWTGACG